MPQESDEESRGKTRRRATLKQIRFAAAYSDFNGANGNGVAAARAAGYSGNAKQLAVQACANLKNPTVQELIATMVDAMVEPALRSLADAIDATKSKAMLNSNGEILYTLPEADHKVRLQAVQFLFDLRTRCEPETAASELRETTSPESREEAIEAAKECLEALAPHLLAATTTATAVAHEPEPAEAVPAAGGDEDQP